MGEVWRATDINLGRQVAAPRTGDRAIGQCSAVTIGRGREEAPALHSRNSSQPRMRASAARQAAA